MKPFLKLRPGDRIITRDPIYVTDERDVKKHRTIKAQVIRQYDQFVLVENCYGTRWCITNAELFQRWYRKKYGDTASAKFGPRFYASGKVRTR